MGKIAFVFSGQGDQHPGMSKALCDNYSAAADVFAMCDSMRPGTSEMCFYGSEDSLRQTINTQPCLFAMELAAARALESAGLHADMAAGFSLGEVVALTYAGTFTAEDGFRAVCRRGELMQAEAEKYPTSMAAVLKLDTEKVQELCAMHEKVYPVNYNCPGQVAVSGLESSMEAFGAAVKAVGGRAMPIKVRGAFHSPFMNDAAAEFSKALGSISISSPAIPVYTDVTALPYSDNIAATLERQICSPVKWEELIRNMSAEGVNTFIEIGPGKTLTNLIGRIDKSVRALPVSAYSDLNELILEVNS